jgi:hypothetical protein
MGETPVFHQLFAVEAFFDRDFAILFDADDAVNALES